MSLSRARRGPACCPRAGAQLSNLVHCLGDQCVFFVTLLSFLRLSSENILVRNCKVKFGVGMTIGASLRDVCPVVVEWCYNLTACEYDSVFTYLPTRVCVGVALVTGSVWPDPNVNCVRNVTFESIQFDYPIKALYVKSNPGTVGTGIIDGITYRDINASNSLWYPIWIGPQQGESDRERLCDCGAVAVGDCRRDLQL